MYLIIYNYISIYNINIKYMMADIVSVSCEKKIVCLLNNYTYSLRHHIFYCVHRIGVYV